jgi:hypothetical protein
MIYNLALSRVSQSTHFSNFPFFEWNIFGNLTDLQRFFMFYFTFFGDLFSNTREKKKLVYLYRREEERKQLCMKYIYYCELIILFFSSSFFYVYHFRVRHSDLVSDVYVQIFSLILQQEPI